MSLLGWLRQKACSHVFYLDNLKKTGEGEDSEHRVSWPCGKCGKVFLANYGLDISPRNGPIVRRANQS